MTAATVVSKTQPLPRPRLHAKLMRGWMRCIDRMGKGAFADAVECSEAGLNKQLSGSLPSLEVLDRALALDPHVLDDWLAAHGLRAVAENAVCDVDDLQLVLSKVLVMINEAEHPDGPGGRAIVHTEYLAGEPLMRELHAATSEWLQRCTALRRSSMAAAA